MNALDILRLIEQANSIPKLNEKYVNEAIKELEALENRSCDNCKNASFEIKFGELEFNACFLVSNGNVCKWESK